MAKTVTFTQMKDGTAQDYALLEELESLTSPSPQTEPWKS